MRRSFVVLAALALPTAACSGSSRTSSSPTLATTSSTIHVAKAAGNLPSESAKMICESEAQSAIYQSATGVQTIAPFQPTWADHVYSCDYLYPNGASMRLSVKEMSSTAETTAYFDSLASKLHKTKDVLVGQGGFQVEDGSVVVRKDYKVLLVDVSGLPASFGVPAAPRGDVAINVAVTVMSCWTGA